MKSTQTCFEGPFGEIIRATGRMAKANPFSFSTKYQDEETDLFYHGYRYLNPATAVGLKDFGSPTGVFLKHHKLVHEPSPRWSPRVTAPVTTTRLELSLLSRRPRPVLAIRRTPAKS